VATLPTVADVREASDALRGRVVRTPVLRAREFGARQGLGACRGGSVPVQHGGPLSPLLLDFLHDQCEPERG
jgi:hypothetical protein